MSGFVDLQVNGYAGVDFNSSEPLSEDRALEVCRRLASDGVDRILATVITAPMEQMLARISDIADLAERLPEFASIVAGIHVEGPFLSGEDGFVGAHPRDAIRAANLNDAKRMIEAGNSLVRLITLAPEMDPGAKVTGALAEQGIVVAAGHCDPTIDQLNRSIDAGLQLFTHLGNACPGQLHRHDNIVQRVLSVSEKLSVSFIADGHHIPDFALSNYLDRVPDENIVIVTDAISAAGLGPGRYELSDQVVEVDDDGAAWASNRQHFAGCATTMIRMTEILKQRCGATSDQIDRWTRLNPAKLIDAN